MLNINREIELDEFEKGTYQRMKDYFNEIICFDKMKIFLSKIFTSNVFKEAFDYLYPKHYKFPFKDQNDAYDFLKKYFHFIPLKIQKIAGITEKFSLEIYYVLKKRKIDISQNLPENLKNITEKILYRGSVVKTGSHEINHDFYNIFLMHSNGMIPLETPRKKYVKERESGRNMEMILFDRKIYQLSLIECLYLLNENNYKKSLSDFRNGFNELNLKDLQFNEDNIFYELNEIFKVKDFLDFGKKTNVRCDENESNFWDDTYIDDIEDINDILGFIRGY